MPAYTLAPQLTCTAAGVVARAYPAPRIITLTDSADHTIVVDLITAGDTAAALLNGMSEGVISGQAYDAEREDHITFDGAHGLSPEQVADGDDAAAVVTLGTGIGRLAAEVRAHELRTRLEASGLHPVLRSTGFGVDEYMLHLPPADAAHLLDMSEDKYTRLARLGLIYGDPDGYMPAGRLIDALVDERKSKAEG